MEIGYNRFFLFFFLLNENSKSEIESLKKIVEALQVQMTTNAIAEGIRK